MLNNIFHVVATCLDPQKAEELNQLKRENPNGIVVLELDVGDETSIASFVEDLTEFKVTFRLAINNAGVSIMEEYGAWTASTFESNFRVNTIGPALISQAIEPFMENGSKLVNVSSGMGSIEWNLNPLAPLDAYAISKCGLNILTMRLAEKYRDKGLIVFAINPGWVKTGMGGEEAPTSIGDAVQQLISIIENTTIEHTGGFLSAEGHKIPW